MLDMFTCKATVKTSPTNHEKYPMRCQLVSVTCAAILASTAPNASERSLTQELDYLHSTLQPMLPMTIDDNTQLIATNLTDTTFSRTFHLAVPLGTFSAEDFNQSMQPALINYVCHTDNQKRLLALGGSHRFVYLALAKETIADISINLGDCLP